MATRKKYFDTKAQANKARKEYDPTGYKGIHVWKMPKGSRHAGKFAVCTELEYLKTFTLMVQWINISA